MAETTGMGEVSADGCVVIRAGPLAKAMGIDDPFAAGFVNEAGIRFFEMARKVDPHYEPHNLCRFKFTSALLEEIAPQMSQAVILGAGFDCRPLYLKVFSGGAVAVYEIDTSAQIRHKRQTLSRNAVNVPAWIEFISCDLNGDLLGELRGRGYDPEKKSVVLIEGLIFSLPPGLVRRLLDPGTLKLAQGSAVIFDCWNSARIESLNGKLRETAGRSFFFRCDFSDDKKAFIGELKALGYSAASVTSLDELARKYLPGRAPEVPESGWRVVLARV